MLLAITTTHEPATDLGFLLHKHPDRFQSFELSFGRAHVFYPEVGPSRTTAALLLDVDTVGIARGKDGRGGSSLGQYVNDRPYVASSLLSVAISQVFGTALAGRSQQRPELAATPIPLSARLEVLPVRGGEQLLHRVFDPLGYSVEAAGHPLDGHYPDWGDSPYYSLTLSATKTLAELLAHLYVLVPVFDNQKHYFVGQAELEKLLAKGNGWLAAHPERRQIVRRYLKHRPNLYREALARLIEEESLDGADEQTGVDREQGLERPLSLNEQRHGAVLAALRACGARSVLDLGSGDGKLLRQLAGEHRFERVVGLDVSVEALARAARRIGCDRLEPHDRQRIELIHGSLTYRDGRLAGFDAAAVVEVVEHFDPPRLSAFERVLFEFARPGTVVLTTPNREYNCLWPTLPAGQFRHPDHRFEWSRAEFEAWASRVAEAHGYTVRFLGVGSADPVVGPPTQMAVFALIR